MQYYITSDISRDDSVASVHIIRTQDIILEAHEAHNIYFDTRYPTGSNPTNYISTGPDATARI